MPTPTATNRTLRRLSGLTTKGRAAVALIALRDQWELLSPSQRRECAELLGRLSVAMRPAKTASPAPAGGNVPLIGRIAS